MTISKGKSWKFATPISLIVRPYDLSPWPTHGEACFRNTTRTGNTLNSLTKVLVDLPLIQENGEIDGSVSRFLSRTPKHLPRIGESVYLLPGVTAKIHDIKYSGSNFSLVHIILEPISVFHQANLLALSHLKGKDKWRISYERPASDL